MGIAENQVSNKVCVNRGPQPTVVIGDKWSMTAAERNRTTNTVTKSAAPANQVGLLFRIANANSTRMQKIEKK
jgi:hypothetical protein